MKKQRIDRLLSYGLTDDVQELHNLVDRVKAKSGMENSFTCRFGMGNDENILSRIVFSTDAYDPTVMTVSLEEDFYTQKPFYNFMTVFYRKFFPRNLLSLDAAFKDIVRELERRKSLEETLKSFGLEPKGISRSVGFEMGNDASIRFANEKTFSGPVGGKNSTVMNYRHSDEHVTTSEYHGIPFIEGVMKGIRDFLEGKITSRHSFDLSDLSVFPSRIRDRIIGEKQ